MIYFKNILHSACLSTYSEWLWRRDLPSHKVQYQHNKDGTISACVSLIRKLDEKRQTVEIIYIKIYDRFWTTIESIERRQFHVEQCSDLKT